MNSLKVLPFLITSLIFMLSGCENFTKNDPQISLQESEVLIEKEPTEAHPMGIETLRSQMYPSGELVIEQTLNNGTNYSQYIASYQSEGLKINGLLTIPLSEQPESGFPAVIFIHGYIPPDQYSTTGNYPTYQARLAQSGFVTFKPDLRGHGNSEGEPVSAHYSEKYIIDTLNAIEHLKTHESVNPEKIVYWGHSNGGQIGLRVSLISKDIQAASLWAGVVGSYEHMFETYNAQIHFLQDAGESELVQTNGWPSENPEFWDTLDPYAFLNEIETPIQIQHGSADESVPVELSRELYSALENNGKTVEYHEYPGDNHNIGINTSTAFERTIEFYNAHLE